MDPLKEDWHVETHPWGHMHSVDKSLLLSITLFNLIINTIQSGDFHRQPFRTRFIDLTYVATSIKKVNYGKF